MSPAITLDPHQVETLQAIHTWTRGRPHGHYQVHGRAGTGKTTLISRLTDKLRAPVLAPTNKAAAVLRKKGISHARTVHSFLYVPTAAGTDEEIEVARRRLAACEPDSRRYADVLEHLRRLRRVVYRLKEREPEHEVVIVDESSMVSLNVGRDLASVVPAVIAFGDPWQLPPVKSDGYFTCEPHRTLRAIHRQGRGSGILDLAEDAHAGRWPLPSRGPEATTTWGSDLTAAQYLGRLAAADQVLVGTHRTRRALNHQLRCLAGRGPLPMVGDTLTCVRCPTGDARDAGLVNGFGYAVRRAEHRGELLELELQDILDGGIVEYALDRAQFLRASLPLEAGGVPEDDDPSAPPLDFDAALTVHKAQGSEWGSVVVVNQSMVFGADGPNWLYTAITRAREQVLVITKAPGLPPLPASYLP